MPARSHGFSRQCLLHYLEAGASCRSHNSDLHGSPSVLAVLAAGLGREGGSGRRGHFLRVAPAPLRSSSRQLGGLTLCDQSSIRVGAHSCRSVVWMPRARTARPAQHGRAHRKPAFPLPWVLVSPPFPEKPAPTMTSGQPGSRKKSGGRRRSSRPSRSSLLPQLRLPDVPPRRARRGFSALATLAGWQAGPGQVHDGRSSVAG